MASFGNKWIESKSVQFSPYVEAKDRPQFEQLVSVGRSGIDLEMRFVARAAAPLACLTEHCPYRGTVTVTVVLPAKLKRLLIL